MLRKVHLWPPPPTRVLLTQQARRGAGTSSEDIRWSREMGRGKLMRLDSMQGFWPSDYDFLTFKGNQPYIGKVRIINSEMSSRSPGHKEKNNMEITGSKEVTVDCGQGWGVETIYSSRLTPLTVNHFCRLDSSAIKTGPISIPQGCISATESRECSSAEARWRPQLDFIHPPWQLFLNPTEEFSYTELPWLFSDSF